MKRHNPPALATKLLESLVAMRTSEALLGDLIEQYRGGRSRAWYWWQVLHALLVGAGREVSRRKLQAVSAILVGYVSAASLCYFTTSLAAQFVWGYKAYLVFLPLVFLSGAVSGWIVRRSHHASMVVIYLGFCLVASVVALALYAWLPFHDRMPAPLLAFSLTSNFIVGPLGVLAGAIWASPGARDVLASPSLDT